MKSIYAQRPAWAYHIIKLSMDLSVFSARKQYPSLPTYLGRTFLASNWAFHPQQPPSAPGTPYYIHKHLSFKIYSKRHLCFPILGFSELILYLFSPGLFCHMKHGSSHLPRHPLVLARLSFNRFPKHQPCAGHGAKAWDVKINTGW